MTIRIDINDPSEPSIQIDGVAYTPDQLRNHLARSRALTTVARWLDQELATTRRQRRLLAHWQRYGAGMQQEAVRLHLELDALRHERREQAQYAQERATRTKER